MLLTLELVPGGRELVTSIHSIAEKRNSRKLKDHLSWLDSAPGSGVIFAHPCQRQGGVKGFCFGSTRGLRTKARKAHRAAKRSAAVSKAPLAIPDCSDVTHLGFGALGSGRGTPPLLCFDLLLLTRPAPENRVTNGPRGTDTNTRRARGALFAHCRGFAGLGVDTSRALYTHPS